MKTKGKSCASQSNETVRTLELHYNVTFLRHSPEYVYTTCSPHLIIADNSLKNKMQILHFFFTCPRVYFFAFMIIVHYAKILEPKHHVHKIYKPGYH
jgi:hypothetical protein